MTSRGRISGPKKNALLVADRYYRRKQSVSNSPAAKPWARDGEPS